MDEDSVAAPVRIADVIDGHVHPALARTRGGELVAVYNEQGGGGKELLLCRSADGGHSWSAPVPIRAITEGGIYPGSLTTLSDGRLLLNWACYRDPTGTPWREAFYSLSQDDGHTWTTPHPYPVTDRTNYTCLRHPVMEWTDHTWVCPFYDRTVVYDAAADRLAPFGDGRNHGMVPMVRTATGTIVSGAPQSRAPVPVGRPGNTVHGLRSSDGGWTWERLDAFPHFGVAGYDLTVLRNGWIVLTAIVYGVGVDGEFAYELITSRDDGRTWDRDGAVTIFDPGRRIAGRGWPRTVQVGDEVLATLYYDLSPDQESGPGLWLVHTPVAALG